MEKGQTFQKPSNYQFFHKLNFPLANHLKLQCTCTGNKNFFISHWDKDLFSDFPGAKVYAKLQHIRILPPRKSTAFHSGLLTYWFHTKTDWQPLFYQKYIMTESGQEDTQVLKLARSYRNHYDESKFIFSNAEIQRLRWGLSSGDFDIMPQQATSFDGFSKI